MKMILPTQFVFRANRSTSDAMSLDSKTPVFAAFIDLKAAYDWIPRDALSRCLDIHLKCSKLITNHTPSPLHRHKGLYQRYEYNIPNEVSLRELRQKTAAHGSDNITVLLCADDQVVFAKYLQ